MNVFSARNIEFASVAANHIIRKTGVFSVKTSSNLKVTFPHNENSAVSSNDVSLIRST